MAVTLSGFVDEKKEDFLISLPSVTFIGEIKGVSSNVRNEHISQTDVHYQTYMDRLEEAKRVKNVRQILIINPFRTKPLEEREPIHETQVNLATRNGCLIVETFILLKAFERFRNGDITSEECMNVLASNCGLLTLDMFN